MVRSLAADAADRLLWLDETDPSLSSSATQRPLLQARGHDRPMMGWGSLFIRQLLPQLHNGGRLTSGGPARKPQVTVLASVCGTLTTSVAAAPPVRPSWIRGPRLWSIPVIPCALRPDHLPESVKEDQ